MIDTGKYCPRSKWSTSEVRALFWPSTYNPRWARVILPFGLIISCIDQLPIITKNCDYLSTNVSIHCDWSSQQIELEISHSFYPQVKIIATWQDAHLKWSLMIFRFSILGINTKIDSVVIGLITNWVQGLYTNRFVEAWKSCMYVDMWRLFQENTKKWLIWNFFSSYCLPLLC